jgi:integrase
MTTETLKVRRGHLARFAEVHPRPWKVTPQDVTGWLTCPRWAPDTRRAATTAIRAFYRWATATGHVDVAPLPFPGPGPAPLLIPAGWVTAVETYARHCAAGGLAQGTLGLRLLHLRQLGEQCPDPWTVSTTDLTRFLANPTWRAETRRAARSSVARFFGWAAEQGFIGANPAATLPRVRVPRGKPRPAPDEAIRAALRDAGQDGDQRGRRMILLAWREGMRRGEIARVHTDHIVETGDGPALRIEGKGGHVRVLPLHPDVLDALTRVREGWVFPSPGGGHLTPAHVGKLLSRLLPEHWTGHTLRHRAGTDWYCSSRDLLAVQQLLGHAKPETTSRYVAVPDTALRACVMGSQS